MAEPKTAVEILEAVVEDGQHELERDSAGLAFSGMACGLSISFSAVALAAVGAMTGGIGLAAMLTYPVGFLIVIMGRAQLFTENTVTPVAVVLTRSFAVLPNMLRMWGIILISNIIGVTIFTATVVYTKVLDPTAIEILIPRVSEELSHSFVTLTFKAIFGGWIVALVAWLMAASSDTISRIFFIYLLVFLIPVLGLAHSIAGSAEVLITVFAGATTWGQYFLDFLVPATLGNAIGGVVLVSMLNYAQVVGSDHSKHFLQQDDDVEK